MDVDTVIGVLDDLILRTTRGFGHLGFLVPDYVNEAATQARDSIQRLQHDLREAEKLLTRAAEEMEESCEREGRLTSMKVGATTIRKFLEKQEQP